MKEITQKFNKISNAFLINNFGIFIDNDVKRGELLTLIKKIHEFHEFHDKKPDNVNEDTLIKMSSFYKNETNPQFKITMITSVLALYSFLTEQLTLKNLK